MANESDNEHPDGLVEEVDTLKGRIDEIETRVDDLQETFEVYIRGQDK
jgi:tetrahydromethanopterin S-methyltransferase subunit B